MPIYEFACDQCGHRFERLLPMSAEPPECPECGGDEARKLVSASAFILKGGGWYKDHYGLKKTASSGAEGGAAGGGGSSEGGGASGTPASKPAESGGSKASEGGKASAAGA